MIDKPHYHEKGGWIQPKTLSRDQKMELRRILNNSNEEKFQSMVSGVERAAEIQHSVSVVDTSDDIHLRVVELKKLLIKANRLMDGMNEDESLLDQYFYLATKDPRLMNSRSHPYGGSETSYLLDGIEKAIALVEEDHRPKRRGGAKTNFSYTNSISILGNYFLKSYPNRKISSGENSVFVKLVNFYLSCVLEAKGVSAKNEIVKLKKAQQPS
ncbi:MAG: hypothetical protein V7708_00800 [Oceanicoccus sp.]